MSGQLQGYEYDCFIKPVMDKFDLLGILPHTKPNAIGMWPNEQECLLWAALQSQLDSAWVEVGSFCGGSTILLGLMKQHRQGTVTAIDAAFNPMFDLNIRRSGLTNIVKVEDHSFAVLDNWSIHEPISFLFLDGYHSFKNVVTEFHLAQPHLLDDAIIAFHDCSPAMWNEQDPENIGDIASVALRNYDSLMESVEEDFYIDEAIAYIMVKYGYEIIDIPIREPLAYHRETGLNEWVRGRTSPHNAFTAIRKMK
jgi:predicted O-methyltransferase YrrM